ncbi:hypothetical protein SRHO_G00131570 [Serrasalmus rhombeus]
MSLVEPTTSSALPTASGDFQFSITYGPSSRNTKVDALSRMYQEETSNCLKECPEVHFPGYQPPLAPWTRVQSDVPATDDWMRHSEATE